MISINQKTDALIIIDMQNDFALSDGALYVKDGIEVAEPIAKLCTKFSNLFFTQDNHPEKHASFASTHGKNPFEVIEMYGYPQVLWPDHCIQGWLGNEIVEELLPELDRAQALIRKGMNPLVDSYSAFRENFGPDGTRVTTGFAGMLRELGLKRLFFVGLAMDYCVRFSAEDALDEGFESFVISDLTKSVNQSLDAEDEVAMNLSLGGVNVIDSSELE